MLFFEISYLGMEPKTIKASAKMKIILVADQETLTRLLLLRWVFPVQRKLWDILPYSQPSEVTKIAKSRTPYD